MLSNLKLKKSAALLAATALVATGCAMMAPKAERYVAPPDGSSYVIQRKDTGSYGRTDGQVPIKVGRRMVDGLEMVTFMGPAGGVLARPSGHWVNMFAGDKVFMSWNPPIGWEWPLEVGKTWTKKYESTNHMNKRTISYESTQTVEAHEEVSVPAGTFKTFRVSTRTSMGDENVVWFSPDLGIWVKANLRRNANHPAGPGSRDDVLLSQNIKR
jgi:hypothetical protein